MQITVKVEGSDDALRTQADKIEAADQALRKSFSGFDLDVVVPEVRKAFDEIGADVPEADVQAYAQAIVDRSDYELTLR